MNYSNENNIIRYTMSKILEIYVYYKEIKINNIIGIANPIRTYLGIKYF